VGNVLYAYDRYVVALGCTDTPLKIIALDGYVVALGYTDTPLKIMALEP
jgi:deoxycytidylate deaminase